MISRNSPLALMTHTSHSSHSSFHRRGLSLHMRQKECLFWCQMKIQMAPSQDPVLTGTDSNKDRQEPDTTQGSDAEESDIEEEDKKVLGHDWNGAQGSGP